MPIQKTIKGLIGNTLPFFCKAWVSSDLTSKDLFVRQGWFKFKKKRSERQRVHLSEWKEDLMAYISEKKRCIQALFSDDQKRD